MDYKIIAKDGGYRITDEHGKAIAAPWFETESLACQWMRRRKRKEERIAKAVTLYVNSDESSRPE